MEMLCSVLEVLSSSLGGVAGAGCSAGGPPRLPPLCAPIGSASAIRKVRTAKFRISLILRRVALGNFILKEVMTHRLARGLAALALPLLCVPGAFGLDPRKALTQYS